MEHGDFKNQAVQRADQSLEEAPIIIKNVKNVIHRSSVQQTAHGEVRRELVVVEVDDGEAVVIQTLMALAIVFVGVQILTQIWRRVHLNSFNLISQYILLGFPVLTALISRSWLFVGLWATVVVTHLVVFRDLLLGRRPQTLKSGIYAGYRQVFKLSLGLSLAGYLGVVYGFFRSNGLLFTKSMQLSMYVLYFTLMVRIGLNLVSARAARSILPSVSAKQSGECQMCPETRADKGSAKILTLSCGESFHEECLQNWKIIGKRDQCPVCHEKVDLSAVPLNSWERNEYVFTQFLNFSENMILAYAVTQGIVFFFKL